LISVIATRTARSAGSTEILSLRTLRRIHGPDFAEGFKGTDKLSDVLPALDEPSLSKLVRDHQTGTLEGQIKQHS
jgi:hypothetical protein